MMYTTNLYTKTKQKKKKKKFNEIERESGYYIGEYFYNQFRPFSQVISEISDRLSEDARSIPVLI
jgi:hypothetical protein